MIQEPGESRTWLFHRSLSVILGTANWVQIGQAAESFPREGLQVLVTTTPKGRKHGQVIVRPILYKLY